MSDEGLGAHAERRVAILCSWSSFDDIIAVNARLRSRSLMLGLIAGAREFRAETDAVLCRRSYILET